nr:MAG TPA: hypothetical protein [Caudoviricetes sp.]
MSFSMMLFKSLAMSRLSFGVREEASGPFTK